jgi:hypothetical protein
MHACRIHRREGQMCSISGVENAEFMNSVNGGHGSFGANCRVLENFSFVWNPTHMNQQKQKVVVLKYTWKCCPIKRRTTASSPNKEVQIPGI